MKKIILSIAAVTALCNVSLAQVNGEQGLTSDGVNTVFLGDDCGKLGSPFKKDREINMDQLNLYFNSAEKGKLYMGIAGDCRKLVTRLEISSKGLPAVNEYDVNRPSTSGLRFTDLTAKDDPIKPKYKGVLSLDEDGDVIWVESPNTGSAQPAWLLAGNAGTSSATNFVGTTDAQDLTFRTANLERLRITQTGRLAMSNNANTYIDGGNELLTGTGNTVIGKRALINNTTGNANIAIGSESMMFSTTTSANVAVGNATLRNTTTGINNTAVGNAAMEVNVTGKFNTAIGNHSLYASSGDNNTALGYLAGANLLSGSNNVLLGSSPGAGDLSNGSNNILIGYGALPNISPNASSQLNIGNWIFGNNGRIGIGPGTQSPTARLHVNAANGVRLQNLPSGTGNVVVIDAAGYLYRATSTAAKPAASEDVEDLKATVEDLKAEIAALKEMMYAMKSGAVNESNWKVDGVPNTLFQNVPNPSDKSTRIEYILNNDCKDAYIALFDINGKVINRIPVKAVAGKGSVQVNIEDLSAGSYPYTLFVNGVKQDAKVMQVVR
jgi:outer membrane murein-binding lipoprotein Lpp